MNYQFHLIGPSYFYYSFLSCASYLIIIDPISLPHWKFLIKPLFLNDLPLSTQNENAFFAPLVIPALSLQPKLTTSSVVVPLEFGS